MRTILLASIGLACGLAQPLAAQAGATLEEALAQRDSARLLELWPESARQIAARCEGWIPTAGRTTLEAVAPGGSLSLGDNGGTVRISLDPEDVRRHGYEVFGEHLYALELAEGQAGLVLQRSSHVWTSLVLSPGTLALLASIDGRRTVAQLAELADEASRQEWVRVLLVLKAADAIEWAEAPPEAPAVQAFPKGLLAIAGEAPAGGYTVTLQWVFDCFWGE